MMTVLSLFTATAARVDAAIPLVKVYAEFSMITEKLGENKVEV